jgi:hypothetical protein
VFASFFYSELRFVESSESGENLQKSQQLLTLVGIASNGKTLEDPGAGFDKRVHRWLPVHRAHKYFYGLLILIWVLVLFSQLSSFYGFITNMGLHNLQ